jgi:hypothetical protein
MSKQWPFFLCASLAPPAWAANGGDAGSIIVGLLVIAGMVWLSIKILIGLFRAMKKFFGWIGPYILAALPGAGTYVITSAVFGVGVSEASISGFLTAAIIGALVNAGG